MKTVLLFVLVLIFGICIRSHSQTVNCECKSDIQFLNEKINKTPAYKRNKGEYEKALEGALQSSESSVSYYECFEIMNRLILSLNDWHIRLYEKSSDSLRTDLAQYSVANFDLDSLKKSLEKKPFESVEGIYHKKGHLTVGILYNEEKEAYQAIILETASDALEKGRVLYKYIPLPNNYLLTIGAQYPSKRLISYYERIHNGVILRAGLQKDTSSTIYTKSPYPNDKYLFKEISPKVDYLKVGSFSSQYPTLREAEEFYKSLEGKLIKEHLILDLRDNGGGGNRNSDILLKQLRKYLKKNRIYVITNASTGSNTEQFTVKLKKHKNVISFGDKTIATLAYEIGSEGYYTLPCTNFTAVLTHKCHKKFLPYETVGVIPDHFLDYEKSWISQVVEFIQNKI